MSRLTTPDLVVLSLLAERPMHGYAVVAELERREVRDWAGISRPQVYYSLRKLQRTRLIRVVPGGGPAAGPERRVYAPTAAARRALADALDRTEWAEQRPPPPFLTWMALAMHARPGARARLLRTRCAFLRSQIDKEVRTLRAIRAEGGPLMRLAVFIVSLAIRQFRLELSALGRAGRVLRAMGP
jgi:DNA-binding PadR family transcriptional regulator